MLLHTFTSSVVLCLIFNILFSSKFPPAAVAYYHACQKNRNNLTSCELSLNETVANHTNATEASIFGQRKKKKYFHTTKKRFRCRYRGRGRRIFSRRTGSIGACKYACDRNKRCSAGV
mmetsp:Transcript_20289/g.46036  ORF Transcript_20289/g.46036 Transcript_20289/m.46036 type:complete len:118 (-) Transcript_20289:2117-2470(-)